MRTPPEVRFLLSGLKTLRAVGAPLTKSSNPRISPAIDLSVICSPIVRGSRFCTISHSPFLFPQLWIIWTVKIFSISMLCEPLSLVPLVRCHNKYSIHVWWFKIWARVAPWRSFPSLSPNSLFLSSCLFSCETLSRLPLCRKFQRKASPTSRLLNMDKEYLNAETRGWFT